jgi:2,6-dihydroxypyridine 3-monooxygenase
MNWGDLHRNLRKRVPDEIYKQGSHVTGAKMQDDQSVSLKLEDGSEATFDLAIFANGYRSIGREMVCDQSLLSYRGYVLWRGVLPERELSDSGPLEGNLNRVGYPEGHGVFYFVPGEDGSVKKGERWVN